MPYLDRYIAPEYEQDLTDTFFDNKLRLFRSKLEMILSKIEERSLIRERNNIGILYDEVSVDNLMFTLPDRFTPYCPPSNQTLQLKQEKLRLNSERRSETSKAWSDIVNLYCQAIDAYLQIKKEENKKEVLENY